MSVKSILIAGNWKMNGLVASLEEIDRLADWIGRTGLRIEMLVCPPATLIAAAAHRSGASGVGIGGQDCHAQVSGAHTGDLSAEMIADAGGRYVIVGHSERRADHGETDEAVADKTRAARRAGLAPIVCVGETESQRDAGDAEAVVKGQLAGSIPEGDAGGLVVAYEPVWAIGTGRTPSTDDIAAMHGAIRAFLVDRFGESGAGVRILYGGSVKPDNAAAILALANVDGALVGGASLAADSLIAIAEAAPA